MRYYHVHILTKALQRASNLTIEEALKSSSSGRNNQDVITFVCTITLPSQILVKLLTNTGVNLKYRQVKVKSVRPL